MNEDTAVVTTEDAKTEDTKPEAPMDALERGLAEANAINGVEAEKKDDTPAAEAKPAEPVAEPTPEEKAKAEVEKEIRDNRWSEKTATRFRELNARPTKEQVEKEMAPIKELAAQAEQFQAIVLDTGASTDQLGVAFACLKAINSNDPAQMRRAYDSMYDTVKGLAKRLGIAVDGVDPVTEHTDLNERIKAGDMTADVARELAQARARAKVNEENEGKTNVEKAFKAEYDQAMIDLGHLNAKLKAGDPDFAAKLELLQPTLDIIKTLPPAKWQALIAEAYTKVRVPAKPAAPVHNPIRASGMPAGGMQVKPKNGLEAADLALAEYARNH